MRYNTVALQLLSDMSPFQGIGNTSQFAEYSFRLFVIVHLLQHFQHATVVLIRVAVPQYQRVDLLNKTYSVGYYSKYAAKKTIV